jgi:hypothetical protein
MRLSRLLFAAAVVAAPTTARADDTADFLKPSNWEGREDLWTVKGNTIVGETKEDPKYNTFLCSKEKYGDFELSFKVQLRDGVGNSGVQIRSMRTDKAGDKNPFRVAGPQVDVGKGYFGGLYGEGVGGYLLKPKKELPKEKEGEFNDYHIVAKGNHVTVKVNGEVTVDDDFPMSNAKSKDPKPAATEGIIAIQVHGGYPKMRVEYKDIVFKKLK